MKMLKKIKVKPCFRTSTKGGSNKEVDNGQAEHSLHRQSLLLNKGSSEKAEVSATKIPTSGYFAVYVGEGRERFVVPTNFLCHPLFKILLEKTYDEFGFEQKNGLIVPCSVSTFKQVVSVVKSNHGRFDMSNLFEELV